MTKTRPFRSWIWMRANEKVETRTPTRKLTKAPSIMRRHRRHTVTTAQAQELNRGPLVCPMNGQVEYDSNESEHFNIKIASPSIRTEPLHDQGSEYLHLPTPVWSTPVINPEPGMSGVLDLAGNEYLVLFRRKLPLFLLEMVPPDTTKIIADGRDAKLMVPRFLVGTHRTIFLGGQHYLVRIQEALGDPFPHNPDQTAGGVRSTPAMVNVDYTPRTGPLCPPYASPEDPRYRSVLMQQQEVRGSPSSREQGLDVSNASSPVVSPLVLEPIEGEESVPKASTIPTFLPMLTEAEVLVRTYAHNTRDQHSFSRSRQAPLNEPSQGRPGQSNIRETHTPTNRSVWRPSTKEFKILRKPAPAALGASNASHEQRVQSRFPEHVATRALLHPYSNSISPSRSPYAHHNRSFERVDRQDPIDQTEFVPYCPPPGLNTPSQPTTPIAARVETTDMADPHDSMDQLGYDTPPVWFRPPTSPPRFFPELPLSASPIDFSQTGSSLRTDSLDGELYNPNERSRPPVAPIGTPYNVSHPSLPDDESLSPPPSHRAAEVVRNAFTSFGNVSRGMQLGEDVFHITEQAHVQRPIDAAASGQWLSPPPEGVLPLETPSPRYPLGLVLQYGR